MKQTRSKSNKVQPHRTLEQDLCLAICSSVVICSYVGKAVKMYTHTVPIMSVKGFLDLCLLRVQKDVFPNNIHQKLFGTNYLHQKVCQENTEPDVIDDIQKYTNIQE